MAPAINHAGTASNENPPSVSPVRTPKLTYKNRSDPLTSGQIKSMPDVPALSGQRTTVEPTLEDEITAIPTKPTSMPTAPRQIDWAVQPVAQKKTSQELNSTPDGPAEKKTKKRGTSFFNFLAVKEPTSGALDQYVQLQKKQAAEKGTAFMSGVSSQRIPAEVPRVNTKWNGLPQSAKADLKRPGTSTAALGGRRNSIATTHSSSKISRRSQASAMSSSMDLEFGPPPSLESLSIKSNPRHDSGTGAYESVPPQQTQTNISSVNGPEIHASGAFSSKEIPQPIGSCRRPSAGPTSAIEPGDIRRERSKPLMRQDSTKVHPKTLKEIAPWAEPPGSSVVWPSHSPTSDADELDFITASPLEATPSRSIADQIAEAERKTASLSMASRRPPSSNAQALSRLEPTGDKENKRGTEMKPSKQRKGKSKFSMFSGKS